MYYLGIDSGATNLRVGIVDNAGSVAAFEKTHTPLRNDPDSFGQKVRHITDNLLKGTNLVESQIEGIGVGVPGPIDFEKGEILLSSNLANQKPIQLKHQLEALFNSKVYIDQDTSTALRGENWVGAGADSQDVVMLTLGTGVGAAVLLNGQIQDGVASEFGHSYIEMAEAKYQTGGLPVCGLGHKGCFESYIKSAKDIKELGVYLGFGLANLVDIFKPQKIIIGGGMVKQGDFLPEAIKVMGERGVKPAVDQVIVQYTQLGDLSGVIGAAKLAMDSIKQFSG